MEALREGCGACGGAATRGRGLHNVERPGLDSSRRLALTLERGKGGSLKLGNLGMVRCGGLKGASLGMGIPRDLFAMRAASSFARRLGALAKAVPFGAAVAPPSPAPRATAGLGSTCA